MDLKHGACQALYKKAGKQMEEECKTKYNNTLEEGTLQVITGGNGLQCTDVFLTALPHYDGPPSMEVYTVVFCKMITFLSLY